MTANPSNLTPEQRLDAMVQAEQPYHTYYDYQRALRAVALDLLARLDAAEAPWQPIETAPRDGTEIDLWSPVLGRVENAKWSRKREAWMEWGPDGFDNMGLCPVEYKVTHWMPLPDPPVQVKQNEEE